MTAVTFASKCWGGDAGKFLSGAFERKAAACEYPFSLTLLVINNGVGEELDGVLAGHADAAVRAPEGNVYAAGERKACSSCQSEFLCFVQGDCITQGGDWITPGLLVLRSEPDVMAVSPSSEVNTWHGADGYDRYMSDQAWLVRTKDFQDRAVYAAGAHDPDYPAYAPGSFEASVGRYLKKTGKKRKILEEFWVSHPAW